MEVTSVIMEDFAGGKLLLTGNLSAEFEIEHIDIIDNNYVNVILKGLKKKMELPPLTEWHFDNFINNCIKAHNGYIIYKNEDQEKSLIPPE